MTGQFDENVPIKVEKVNSDYQLSSDTTLPGNGESPNKGQEGAGQVSHDSNSTNGLSVLKTVATLVGEMAGAGILTLPSAMERLGYIGIVMFPLSLVIGAVTGNLLGKSWLIVQERYDEHRGHVRSPYAVIGRITYGKPGSILVNVCIVFSMFGASVVLFILTAQNLRSLAVQMCDLDLPFCYLMLAVAGVLLPFTWLGTPKDFWFVSTAAAIASLMASVILMVAMIKDAMGPYRDITTTHAQPEALLFFQSVGVLNFAAGGHAAFPNFQTDMKQPAKFGQAVYIAFFILLLIYLPVGITGFLIYGSRVKDNILLTVSPGPLLYMAQILMTFHLFTCFVIVFNPVVQSIEDYFKLRKEFSVWRIVSRTSTFALMLLVAETVPRFGSIMSLIGGGTLLMVTFVFPIVFYLKLRKMEGPWPNVPVELHTKVFLGEILLVASMVVIASTYGSILAIAGPDSFTVPCFINMAAAEE